MAFETRQDEFYQDLTKFVLGRIVRSLPADEGKELIGKMPRALRSDLEALAPGPDDRISLSNTIDGLIARYGFGEQDAQHALISVCNEVVEHVPRATLKRIRDRLPDDLGLLFERAPKVA